MYVIFSAYPHLPSRPSPANQQISSSNCSVTSALISGADGSRVSIFGRTIKRGDLLVTSAAEGYVMNGTDPIRMLGPIVSKALGSISCTGDEGRHA
jgi:hypothetical protein